jgi:hypothetical protein
MAEMPLVIDAQYDGEYRIRVTFDDGSRNSIDFRKWLTGPVFEPLRDAKYFQRFFVSGETISGRMVRISLPRHSMTSGGGRPAAVRDRAPGNHPVGETLDARVFAL